MKFQARVFSGMRPSRSTDLLTAGEAQYALNTKLTGGDLDSFKGLTSPGVTFAGGTVVSMYRFGQTSSSDTLYWFQSAVDADFVRGPVDLDTTERTYWTDGVYPKKSNAALATTSAPYPTASYRMGIPVPASGMTFAISGSPTYAPDPAETILYCFTYVSAWGEEGPPSPVTTSANWQPGQTSTISSMPVAPSGNYNIVGKRLYRSATGSQSTKFQLVNTEGDIPIATTTYVDTKLTAVLGETLATTGWFPPPDTMTGLVSMANGIMAGFTGNTLCFCEPYTPYAWPVRYQQSTDAPIIAIAPFDQSLFVGTTQGIYIFTGADPSSMTSEKLPVQQSCASKRSVVAMMGGVLWASPDGLMKLTSAGIENLTEGLMTRVEWQAYVPSSITAFETDNRYLAFYDNGTTQGGMIFSFGSEPTFSLTDIYATAGYRDRQRDALYLSVGNVLKKWDAGTGLTYDWLSGIFHLPSEVNMGCAIVDASAYPVTFKLYADNTLQWTQTVADKYAFRLPSGYRSRRYSFELIGTSLIREVTVATTMAELASG